MFKTFTEAIFEANGGFMYAGIPVAFGLMLLIEFLKVKIGVNKRYLTFISLFLGLVASFALFNTGDKGLMVINGLYLGLAPVAIYENIDNVIELKEERE